MSLERSVDLVFVVPGLLGSVLECNGEEVWGPKAGTMVRLLLSLGRRLTALAVPAGRGDDDPADGVRATRLFEGLHLIPGLWRIDHYGRLLDLLRRLGPEGGVVDFPYDWRLSVRLNACRLAKAASDRLEQWQRLPGRENSRLVFVCHSLGGLVTRYFVEVLGGHEITRRVITIGTPHRGSLNALFALTNRIRFGSGPLSMDLTPLARSLPSLYQLLPTFACVTIPGETEPRPLAEVSIPDLSRELVLQGGNIHAKIGDAVHARAGQPEPYELHAVVGQLQPTKQAASVTPQGLVARYELDGIDYRGDGTVPRFSASPPEWRSDDHAIFSAQRHATLQASDLVLTQLHGVLTSVNLGAIKGTGRELSLDLPDLVCVGEDLRVEVSTAEERLALGATVKSVDTGKVVDRHPLRNLGEGRYHVNLLGLPPGAYRITVANLPTTPPVDSVSDVAVVWPVD